MSLQELSSNLNSTISRFSERLAKVGAPQPTLTEPFPERILDDEAQNAKIEILKTCERIMATVAGPVEWGMYQNMGFVEPACVSVILELGIPELVGNGEVSPQPTSLDELVEATGASKDILSMSRTPGICFTKSCPLREISDINRAVDARVHTKTIF
jgi:sterigmatocystin 8-O-methyltransferase